MAHIFLFSLAIFSLLSIASSRNPPPQNLNLKDNNNNNSSMLFGSSMNRTSTTPRTMSFNLYHRDFFEEVKDRKSLQEAQLKRDAARFDHLTSLLSNPGAGAPSFPLQGEFMVSILIGNPPQKEYLVMDTGCSMTWWQCGPCDDKSCYKQNKNDLYNSETSSSFVAFDCTRTRTCATDHTDCTDNFPHRCNYQISYGSGQRTTGFMAYETIVFSITQTESSILFGCGRDQRSGTDFDSEFSGIFGLGGGLDPNDVGQLSMSSQLNSKLFSFCLPSPTLGKESWLYFNTVPPLPPMNNNVKAPLLKDENLLFYYVQLKNIMIGSYFIDVRGEWNGHIMVDSGTTISRIPRSVYNRMKEGAMRYMAFEDFKPIVNPPSPFELCYKGYIDSRDFPSVDLVFDSVSNENTLYLSEGQVAIEVGDLYCLAFIPSDTYYILGNTQLYGTALTFDLSDTTLTFTQNSCIS